VWAKGQGGLFDVVAHPDYPSNRRVYLSFAKPSDDGARATLAVVRGVLTGGEPVFKLDAVEEVFVADAWSASELHFGGRLAFDDKGYLFVSVGDRSGLQIEPRSPLNRQAAEGAQDLATHLGKVVRLQADGRVPPDNPFVNRSSDFAAEIWTYGHKNPQGLFAHSRLGELWETEHGPQGGDELNVLEKGSNYGWPIVGLGMAYGGGIPRPMHAFTQRPGMQDPVRSWSPAIGPSGLLVYEGPHFREWRGSMFVGAMTARYLGRLVLDGRSVVHEERLLPSLGRVRDVRACASGHLYVLFDTLGSDEASLIQVKAVS
jgi:glucose/arabinose dehydrogenase